MSGERQGIAYGGQAVIEGVMIRGRAWTAVACRRKDGTIATETRPLRAVLTRFPWLNRPLLRGTFALWDSLALGFGSLFWSANLALEDEGEKPISRRGFALTVVGAMALGMLIFVILPSLVTPRLGTAAASNITEGLLRKGIFLIYVLIIMRLPDVKRLFAYHGAEHKVVNAYEHGDANPQVAAYSRLHRRCGTTFIAVVIVVGIVVHMTMGWPVWYWRLLSRLAVLPVIAGISYEVIRLASRYEDSILLRALVWPGLLIQRLTTREPTPDMIEVAHAALRAVRAREEGDGPEATANA